MSIHPEGRSYRVRWTENEHKRSRSFARRDDAVLFDAEIKRAKALGPHIMRELIRSTETLDDFIRGPWRAHAASLAPKTRAKYRWVLDNHLGDLADEPLVTLDVACLAAHQRHLLDGGLRPNTVREVLRMIAGILQIAAEHGRITANPARSMRKVKAAPRQPIHPLAPVELEQLIAAATGRLRIVIVLGGHLGLRPIEIRSVPWLRLHDDTLTVAKADTKPSAEQRTIHVPAATRQALRQWRLEAGRPASSQPIVGLSARNMNEMNVRLRKLAAGVIGRDDLTLYTLRHTAASLLHHCGYTVPRAAERMGHTTIVHLRHYAHVIDAVGDARWSDLDELIAAARGTEQDRQRTVTSS